MAIGPKAYKLVLDVRDFTEGIPVTRREMSAMRRIMEETKPAAEKLGDTIDQLNNLLNKGMPVEDYRRALAAVKSELPENVAAQQLLNDQLQRADQIRQSLLTTEQREQQQIDQLNGAIAAANSLAAQGIKTEQERAEAVEKLTTALHDRTVVLAEVVDEEARSQRTRNEAVSRGLQLNNEFLPAHEQARRKMIEVNAAYRAGHIEQSAYRNAQIQLTATQLSGLPVVGRFAGAIAGIHPAVIAATAGLAIGKLGVDAFSAAFDFSRAKIKEQYGELDRLANAADKLSLPVDQFLMMSHAADRADLDVAQFTKGYETMLDNVSKASAGKKKPLEAFELIGVDAKRLKDQKPEEVLATVTEALGKVTDASDRIRAAKGIFGDSDFLRLDVSDLNRAKELMAAVGLEVTALDRSRLSEFNAATKDLNFVWDSLWKRIAIDLAPALTDFANAGTEVLIDLAKSETFTDTLREAVDLTHTLAAVARGIPDSIAMWGSAAESSGLLPWLRAGASAATMGLSENIAGASDDIGAARRREGELDAQLRAKGLGGSSKSTTDITPDDSHKKGHRDFVRETLSALDDEQKKLQLSAIAYQDRKLALAGAGILDRVAAAAISMRTEEMKKEVEAAKAAGDALKRRQDAIRGIIGGLDEERAKLTMSAAAYHDRQVAMAGGGILDRVVAAAKFDDTEKLKKEVEAAKLAKDAIKELEKEKRQSGMTEREKKLDDFRTEGVLPEELQRIDLLLKEKELREAILKTQQASAFVIKSGSREEAEMLVQSQRAAMLRSMSVPISSTATGKMSSPFISAVGMDTSDMRSHSPSSTVATPVLIPPPQTTSITELQRTGDPELRVLVKESTAVLQQILKKPTDITVEEVSF